MLRFQKTEAFVNKHGYFKGPNVTKYLKMFNREMKLCRMTDNELKDVFILLLDDAAEARAQLVIDHNGSTWTTFQEELKEAFKAQDADRPDVDSFLAWVNSPKSPGMTIKDIYADFCLKHRDLGGDCAAMLPNKVRLLVQSIPVTLRRELVDLLLEEDSKLITLWDKVKGGVEKLATILELCALVIAPVVI